MRYFRITLMLSLFCLAWGPAAFAENTQIHSEGRLRTVAGPTPSFPDFKDLVRFQGHPVLWDESKLTTFDYISPNEHSNHLFEPCLPSSGGAFISVGTFRGINVASSGKISHLVLLDYDDGIVLFNLLNVQLLAAASNRFEYLSLLITGQSHPALEKDVQGGRLSLKEFAGELESKQPDPEILVSRWRKLGLRLSDSEWVAISNNASKIRGGVGQGMFNEMAQIDGLGNSEKTIWGNDSRFDQFQTMIREQKVTVVRGDLTKANAFTSLLKVLRANNMKVAALDISNVPSWLGAKHPKTAAIFANARTLPFSPGGRLFLTTGASPNIPGDTWNYYAFKAESIPRVASFAEGSWESTLSDVSLLPVDPSNLPDRPLLRTLRGEACK